MIRTMYHTQESRSVELTQPVKCVKAYAWLGEGYYFWYDELDAFNWGISSKRKTGYFEIYVAQISCDDILDTVFNEEHYKFWLSMVEKAAKSIMKHSGTKPSIKDINDYFRERAHWKDVAGIMFQDIPENESYVMVMSMYYRKRIQLAVYDLRIVLDFNLKSREQCI